MDVFGLVEWLGISVIELRWKSEQHAHAFVGFLGVHLSESRDLEEIVGWDEDAIASAEVQVLYHVHSEVWEFLGILFDGLWVW